MARHSESHDSSQSVSKNNNNKEKNKVSETLMDCNHLKVVIFVV